MTDRAARTPPATTGLPRSRGGRILGVDAARALALVGMFATHILPLRDGDDVPTLTGLIPDGRASALFAVLAGVGVALSSGGPRRPVDGRAHLAAAGGLIVRGLLVGLLGLWLVAFDSPVAVILAYYGLLFVVATPLLRLPAAVLGCGAVLVAALAPVASQLLRAELPEGPGEQPGLDALARPGELVVTLAVTGYYPVLVWTTYLLAGMAVGRLDLRRLRVAVGLLVGGAALAVAAAAGSAWLLGPGGGTAALGPDALAERNYGTTPTDSWWWLAVNAPHSGTPVNMVHTTGTALAVLGAMLLLARRWWVVVWLPAAVGAIPLTLYTLHVILLSVYSGEDEPPQVLLGLWLAHVTGAVLIGVVFRLAGRRGPLEAVVSAAGRAVRRAIDPRSGPGTGPGTGLPTGPARPEDGDPTTAPIPVVPAQVRPTQGRPAPAIPVQGAPVDPAARTAPSGIPATRRPQ
jgi:hypothetical protein